MWGGGVDREREVNFQPQLAGELGSQPCRVVAGWKIGHDEIQCIGPRKAHPFHVEGGPAREPDAIRVAGRIPVEEDMRLN